MLSQETLKSARVLRRGKASDLLFSSLVKALGRSRAETLDFYLDTRLGIDDPERYERLVKLLLGEHAGRLALEGIKTELATTTGIDRSSESLLAEVRAAERALRKENKPSSSRATKA